MYRLFSFCFQALMGEYFLYKCWEILWKRFKANDNKNEEHEINYRQFNKKLELLNQILSLISDINQAADEKVIDTIRFYCTAR